MSDVLTLAEAERLAERTLAAMAADDQAFIDRFGHKPPWESPREKHRRVDRERVASDLAGLRDALEGMEESTFRTGSLPRHWQRYERQATRYSDGLRRTAALLGVTA